MDVHKTQTYEVSRVGTAILFVPGMNAENQYSLFEFLKKEAWQQGVDTVFLDDWKSEADLNQKNIADVIAIINAALFDLIAEGYEHIFAVGKSFGGAMLLAANPGISGIVLWAPAIGVSQGELGTLEELRQVSFSKINSCMDVTLGKFFLQNIQSKICIIHGLRDETISPENSVALHNDIPGSTLKIIENIGHSPKNDDELFILIKTTFEFINSQKI